LVETFGFRLKQVGPSRAVDEPLPPRGRRTIELGGYTLDGPLEPWRFERIGPLPPDLVAVADGFGMFVARRPYGDGFVTVVADGGIFTNPRLARADHARLFLDAVAGHIEPGAVWLVYSEDFPSLAALIWQNARYFVLGAALWTVL